MKTISLLPLTGDFAENKDIARKTRLTEIEPALNSGETVTLDFNGIASATQSFVHALISEVIRKHGVEVLDTLLFKNCNDKVQTIIQIVVEYVQDGIFSDLDND